MADLIHQYDPQALTFAGGLLGLYDSYTHWWWVTFVDEIESHDRLDTVQGVHLHAYPIFSTGLWTDCMFGWCIERLTGELEHFYARYVDGLGLGNRPVWISETGSAPWCMPDERSRRVTYQAVNDCFMEPLIQWFESQDNYDALYWFIPRTNEYIDGKRRWQCSFLVEDTGSLTPLGVSWQRWSSTE
jgi:hypothetical protein